MYDRGKHAPWWQEAFVLTRAVFGVLFWPLAAIFGGMIAIGGAGGRLGGRAGWGAGGARVPCAIWPSSCAPQRYSTPANPRSAFSRARIAGSAASNRDCHWPRSLTLVLRVTMEMTIRGASAERDRRDYTRRRAGAAGESALAPALGPAADVRRSP